MYLHSLKREIYSQAIGFVTSFAARDYQKPVKGQPISLFYCGARGGNRGGPQVKVDLLQQYFPQSLNHFHALYLLSGALYMPSWALQNLRDKDVPIILNQNGVFYPAWYPNSWEFENERMAKALSLSNHVFYQSQFCKKSADKFLGISATSYDILYNGVDTEFFKPVHEGIKKRNRFRFLITGNISSSTYYRLTKALDALASARHQGLDIEIVFRGMLPQATHDEFKVAIQNKNMEEFFILGKPYGRIEAPSIFANADAYIMTKHNDPCPNVVLEAMSCGLPILHLSSGGTSELVGIEAGVSLPVVDTYDDIPEPPTKKMVAGFLKIIQEKERMSFAARHRAVTNFDIQLWIDRHRQVFNKCFADR